MGDFKAKPPSPRRVAATLKELASLYPEHPLDVKDASAFRVLVATMLSARTKDAVTNTAVRRLWEHATTPEDILAIASDDLAGLLKPVGFYKQKSKHLHKLCSILLEDFSGVVPASREELMSLPGVGRKTANLVLNIAFNKPAVCVDTHVHRITNRLGWVSTATPGETEEALMNLVPRKHWAVLNRVVVNHGQQVCLPVSPRCSQCAIANWCSRVGVIKYR